MIGALCASASETRGNWEKLRNGGQRREVSRLRAKISLRLGHGLGIPIAEIARHVGVYGSAVIKAIQKMESADQNS